MTTESIATPLRGAIPGTRTVPANSSIALRPLVDGQTSPHIRIGLAELALPGDQRLSPMRHGHASKILCVLDGVAATHYGAEMIPLRHGPGDMVYLPAGLDHAVGNRSPQPLIALVAQELLPGHLFAHDTFDLIELQPTLDQVGTSPPSVGDPSPTRVEAHGDGVGHGLVPIVHHESVPGATLSSARLSLPAATASPEASVICAQVHSREQRILLVLSGRLAVIYGRSEERSVMVLKSNEYIWVPNGVPYFLANVGHQQVVGVAYSTDPTFDGNSRPYFRLDHDARRVVEILRQGSGDHHV